MDFKDLRVGYAPYDSSLNKVGDRRRFVCYAEKRKIEFELARRAETYDVLVLTEMSDISYWSRQPKGKTRIVFQLINSHLAAKSQPRDYFKNSVKFITGKNRYPLLNQKKAYINMCRRADAVVCTTMEQKQDILQYCDNVHVILDFHNMVISGGKADYTAGEVFNIVWEGLPSSVYSLRVITEALRALGQKHRIALHVVTDADFKLFLWVNKWRYKYRTTDIVRKFFDNVYVYEWNEPMLPKIIAACDLAVIPIDLNDPYDAGRPENKLLLFWRLGMPAVVSATPSYTMAAKLAGLDIACRNLEDWTQILQKYLTDEKARREAGERGKEAAEKYYSEEKLLNDWDNLFRSVLSF